MNAPVTLPPLERIAQLEAVRDANIARLIRKLEAMRKHPRDAWSELEALDAARHVWDADGLETLMQDAMFELGCNSEGFPLTDEGDPNWNADRKYTPMQREG